MKRYAIGMDFGTLSMRALLVDIENGNEVAQAVYEYPHAVIEGEYQYRKLERDAAFQYPQDYLDALTVALPELMKKSGVDTESVVGIGVDFTSSTVLPVDKNGTPLCFDEKFRHEPQALAKLWKHHASEPQAIRYADVLAKEDPERLKLYGGKISSEWLFPKVTETLEKAPAVYEAAERFIEAGDFICWQLTGKESHSVSAAGYKALWNAENGYPKNEIFVRINPKLDGIIGTKVADTLVPLGSCVGTISRKAAEMTGLREGIPVAAAYIDAHAGLPGSKITESGQMLMIIGTSTGHLVLSDVGRTLTGICGVVDGGVVPGKYAYEAGQGAVGDIFDWFVKNCVPEKYAVEARERGISVHALLTEKAEKLRIGESGLLALDWWNGNRSILQNQSLSGLLIGMTLATKPEEIYRALLEATAFGTRRIIDNFAEGGVVIDSITAAGGIASKNKLMMQIYADVIGQPIRLASSAQSPALGSAIAGTVAAGVYPNFTVAADRMGGNKDGYFPKAANTAAYETRYRIWCELHDYFGLHTEIMKKLREL